MQIQYRGGAPNTKFYSRVDAREFDSKLEIPNGANPRQNAWLTITINYTLNFVDSRNPSKVQLRNGKPYSKTHIHQGKAFGEDSDGDEFALRDWDLNSRSDFVRRFNKGEDFWNHKFLLVTPADYDGLDFESPGARLVCRPNVLCLFRLKSGGTPTHLALDVVRPESPTSLWDKINSKKYRSDDRNYAEQDAQTRTLWHELGHALDQLHIRALQGDAKCLADINADRCYEGNNIMGRGTELEPLNAKAWRELIFHHTDVPEAKWNPTMAVNTPPRSAPLTAKPKRF